MIQPILQEKMPQLREILINHHVKAAHAFGSVCTDRFREDSDIDILVSFGVVPEGQYALNFWSLEEALTNLFQRQVEIVVEQKLRNPYFIKVMNQTKTPLYV